MKVKKYKEFESIKPRINIFEYSKLREEEIEEIFFEIIDNHSLSRTEDEIIVSHLAPIYDIPSNSYSIKFGNYKIGSPEYATYPELNFQVPSHKNIYLLTISVKDIDQVHITMNSELENFKSRISKFEFMCEIDPVVRKINSQKLLIYNVIIKDIKDGNTEI